jgi:hypothetical protein
VLPATVAMLLRQHHSLLSVITVTSNDAIKVTIYNCRNSRAERRVRARPKPHRQSRYVIRLPAILAELCRIVHR